ncbi:MAG: sodium:solute symporter [Candidatus Competibacteraceae bacterium]|nr:sodium:solute symporter [Candidatus Competibacteraceae bacterium]
MEAKTVWLIIFVALYWSYCLFWGIKGALSSKTATDYMLAGRGLGMWVFILAATATSFSGWTFMGHPGLIYRDGFQYAYASFYAITIPFTGVMFLKRQWMLGKRFGFITPGEMLAAYFKSDLARVLTVLVALVFSIPYLGLQLRASGFLFNVLTDGALNVSVGMWLLSAVVAAYVASGGLRAVAYVDTMQCILLAGGIIALGVIAMVHVPDMRGAIAALTAIDPATGQAAFGKTTPDGYSAYIAIPGVIQFVSDGPKAVGGAWTGIMVLTYMFALMGIQSAPAFSMWSFANKSPQPFPWQQVWASSFGIGLILFVFTAYQGIGSHFLGANQAFLQAHPNLASDVMVAGLGGIDIMESEGKQGMLVPQLIWLMGDTAPWLVGLLSVCALAAMQSTGAAYMSTAGSMITRDLLRRYVMPNASDVQQKFWGRTFVIGIVLAALVVATTATDALVLLGGLAVAYGFMMWPSLIAVCWWPFLTRQGIVVGLIAGLIVVTLTESIGQNLFSALGVEAPWGRWPWTIHSAGWGILFNLGLAIIISAVTQNQAETEHRMTYHNFLRQHASLPVHKRGLVPAAWIITLVWFFFGIGPGAVLGNWIFGNPTDPTTWLFGLPSIWTWQLLWWALGVFMMWFLAFKMEMSTVPETEVEVLVEAAPQPAAQ